ncbi:BEN domain-containing protein 7 isoform X2 [Brienomyrus brachyistius]|uniref:BEN domain-containing protein 7 isoform X2 n=1 Tax=Brienomyrus brachyistius TaxID=42636 RepID=UPI0020B373EB|nr:BEN domain-containing protein 7 isoform X2 [Brienomyrus brachyistius]
MEFAERKRSRKSQSFKLVNEEDNETRYFDGAGSIDVNGRIKDVTITEGWLGDDGMEIKRQITGMMRLLSDKASRGHQRPGGTGDSLKAEPQDAELSWGQPLALCLDEPQHSTWNLEPAPRPQVLGQYSTRSKTSRMLRDAGGAVNPNVTSLPGIMEANCCMCNCKSTLQAILQELRAVRKLMQRQKVAQEKQQRTSTTISPIQSPVPRKRPCKRRPAHKVVPVSLPGKRASLLAGAMPDSCGGRDRGPREISVLDQLDQSGQPPKPASPPPADDAFSRYNLQRDMSSSEVGVQPEVQLAEDYDVFISKSQLDSILVNYTRSGSLLFRKLVCAFFDDETLANSLPNGKRKRGLNDNRKGLDQNIVGAIKVFTEKYCTTNKIEKLPGPRDWVQILQDQIKLARRRLKRQNMEAADAVLNKTAIYTTGLHFCIYKNG